MVSTLESDPPDDFGVLDNSFTLVSSAAILFSSERN